MSWVTIPFYRQLAGIYKSLNIIVGDIGKEEKEKIWLYKFAGLLLIIKH
jgi:hypothetical protein